MSVPFIIEQNIANLNELCEQFKVKRLYAFGSVITERFDPEKSDLDLLVELEEMSPIERGEKLIALWESLEDLFARKVDLLTDQPIKNPYLRASIDETKQLIYERGSKEVFS
ncbi:MAG: nucleotidyltransferase domain-containing protein [Bacteroidota bacterium]